MKAVDSCSNQLLRLESQFLATQQKPFQFDESRRNWISGIEIQPWRIGFATKLLILAARIENRVSTYFQTVLYMDKILKIAQNSTMVKSEHTLLANEMNQLISAGGNQGVIDGLIANNCDNHLNT